MTKYATASNQAILPLDSIPVLPYEVFVAVNTELLRDESNHCVQYFGFPQASAIKLISCVANDGDGSILISSSIVNNSRDSVYPSLTAKHFSFHAFERILHEKFGIRYSDHPWLKPIRYAWDRADKNEKMENYPFFQIKSEELHEVGVGPIHAGIIEPGHFRFICNGEQILHLEMQKGYQHRGMEGLFLSKTGLLQRTLLAESIAGDSAVGHTLTFVNLWEALCGYRPSPDVQHARTVGLELERIAVHTGDLSAICSDIGYQLGSAVFGRLRTPVINFMQEWCGNRLGKGLIRVGANPWHFSKELARRLEVLFGAYEADLDEMWHKFHSLPGAMARLEKTGVVSRAVAASIGAVGMTARASGVGRDIRKSHRHDLYHQLSPVAIVKHHGDVYSRTQLRHDEIIQSIYYVRKLIRKPPPEEPAANLSAPAANAFAISLTEGWRGEICHCAITDDRGSLLHYAIKDPSIHNWLAVAMAVRNNEISDFPVCNKSFNLSYCGHDL